MKKRIGRLTILLFVILGVVCVAVMSSLVYMPLCPFGRTWRHIFKRIMQEIYESVIYIRVMFIAICIGDPYFYWKTREGNNVIYKGSIKMLTPGTIGILHKVHRQYAIIVYEQNTAYEDNGKGGWKPIKNVPNEIYSHTVKLTDLKENIRV